MTKFRSFARLHTGVLLTSGASGALSWRCSYKDLLILTTIGLVVLANILLPFFSPFRTLVHKLFLCAHAFTWFSSSLRMLTKPSVNTSTSIDQVSAFYQIGRGQLPPVPSSLSLVAREFIHKCLRVDPDDRPSADELLGHPFVAQPDSEQHVAWSTLSRSE